MDEKTDMELFLDQVPALKNKYLIFFTYTYHFLIFIFVMFIFWRIGSYSIIFSLPLQLMVASGSTVPFIYIAQNFDKLRKKYLKKYPKHPWQFFWYHYSYTSPLGCAALYSPLLFKTDYILPKIIDLPSNFLTNNLFPFYSSLPLGFILIIMGILLVKPSKNRDRDMDAYLHMMYPEKNKIINNGIYRYIRHPRFLSRLILSLGFGIIANNIFAILLAIIHFMPYYILMRVEDKKLKERYGNEVEQYHNKVPALIPRCRDLNKFIHKIF